MRFSFMSFSCPELSLDGMLALARRLGYDGVEPRIGSGHAHGIELDASPSSRRGSKRAAQESGIALCCVATSCQYCDPETHEEMVADTHRAIDLAADVGAPAIRVFGGIMAEGVTRQAAVKLLAESMRAVADHAGERGVTVCVETHDHWCDPSHLVQVMKRVDHPAIAVNWDIMHPVHGADVSMDQAFQTLKPWIRHVHFHDGGTTEGKWGLVPVGKGDIDHRRAVQLLQSIGYDGFLSGEWIGWEPYETHLPRELATMKRYAV